MAVQEDKSWMKSKSIQEDKWEKSETVDREEYEQCESSLDEALTLSQGGNGELLESAWKAYKRAYMGYRQLLFQDYAVNGMKLVGIVRGHTRYSTECATAKVYLEHQERSAENAFDRMLSMGLLQNPMLPAGDNLDLESARSGLKTLLESDPEPVLQHMRFTAEVVKCSVQFSAKGGQDLIDLVRILRMAEDALENEYLEDLDLTESELSTVMEIVMMRAECNKLINEKWKTCSDIFRIYLASGTYYKFFKDAMQFERGEPERSLARLKELVPKPEVKTVRSHEEFWHVLDLIYGEPEMKGLHIVQHDADIDQLLEFIEGNETKKKRKRKKKNQVEQSSGGEKSKVSKAAERVTYELVFRNVPYSKKFETIYQEIVDLYQAHGNVWNIRPLDPTGHCWCRIAQVAFKNKAALLRSAEAMKSAKANLEPYHRLVVREALNPFLDAWKQREGKIPQFSSEALTQDYLTKEEQEQLWVSLNGWGKATCELLVRNVPPSCSSQDLCDLFSDFGEIHSSQIFRHRGWPKVATVTFKSSDAVLSVVKAGRSMPFTLGCHELVVEDGSGTDIAYANFMADCQLVMEEKRALDAREKSTEAAEKSMEASQESKRRSSSMHHPSSVAEEDLGLFSPPSSPEAPALEERKGKNGLSKMEETPQSSSSISFSLDTLGSASGVGPSAKTSASPSKKVSKQSTEAAWRSTEATKENLKASKKSTKTTKASKKSPEAVKGSLAAGKESVKADRASDFQKVSSEEVASRDENMKKSFSKTFVQDNHGTPIQKKEALLQETRNYLDNLIEVEGKKMARLITSIETIEDQKNEDLKEISAVEMKISNLQADLERLLKTVKERDDQITIAAKEKKDLEMDMENKITGAKKEIALLESDIESLKIDVLPKSSKEAKGEQRKTNPNMQLLEYIDNKIKAKEKELECPVCLEVASAPIFMCSDSHLICSDCKPKVTKLSFSNSNIYHFRCLSVQNVVKHILTRQSDTDMPRRQLKNWLGLWKKEPKCSIHRFKH